MTRTPNPLHNFRSYSSHQILIACDTTRVAEAISGLTSSLDENRGTLTDRVLNLHGAERGVVLNKIADGNFVVVINGLRDSEFIISEAKWSTVVIPEAPSNSTETIQVTTMATEGIFSVVEPKGIRYLNVLNEVGLKLKTGPTGITWILKTVFIGHTDTGAPEFFTNVKPIMFFMVDVMGNFDEGGSVYDISFIGQANGASKLPQLTDLKIPAISISSEDYSLKTVIEKYLVSTIQNQYDYYLEQTGQDGKFDGRAIVYDIKLDDEYTEKNGYMYDESLVNQQGVGNLKGAVHAFGTKLTIDQAIAQLMLKCSKVKLDSKGNPKYLFKIHSTMLTTDTDVQLTYYVRKYIQPEAVVLGGNINIPTDSNVLTFDYIYTGKNIDIKNFDIKMQMGMAFFQTLEATATMKDNQKEQQTETLDLHNKANVVDNTIDPDNRSSSARAPRVSDKKTSKRIKFPSATYRQRMQLNHVNGLNGADFQTALAKHAALENLEAKVTIHGNPVLMNDINVVPSDFNTKFDQATIPGAEIMTEWLHVPMLCKINIKMPSNTSLTGVADETFGQSFWYDGFYTILAIENIFKDGLFIQELDLLSIPQQD